MPAAAAHSGVRAVGAVRRPNRALPGESYHASLRGDSGRGWLYDLFCVRRCADLRTALGELDA